MEYQNRGYLIATDHFPADGVTDIAPALQKLIDENPNRTIFFPDGLYLLGQPVLTPAHPERSVDLQLSNFARLKAADSWDSDEAMIRLGAKDSANDIYTPGSNYGLSGGILDGSGKAKGISIDGGRETYIRNTSIKNVQVGIHIKYGTNAGSSDADVTGVNITGNGSLDSIGVLIDGFDNTLTNMRIADVFTGVVVNSGGNMLRNIHPLFIIRPDTYGRYRESVGFKIGENPMNWFDYCYSDQFAVGFDALCGGILQNCFCWWYSDKEDFHLALRTARPFCGSVDTLVVGGSHHPDHPNLFAKDLQLSPIGTVRNVVVDQKPVQL